MDKLTVADIQRAFYLLRENDAFERKSKESRSLKDFSNMSDFRRILSEEIGRAENDERRDELLYFGDTIEKLAQGYFLVAGTYVFNLAKDQLRNKWKVPEEVIANIFESKYLSSF